MVLGSMVELAVCAATKLAKIATATVDLTNILIDGWRIWNVEYGVDGDSIEEDMSDKGD